MPRSYVRALVALLCVLPGFAASQPAAWPTRPVRFIVAYPPGGSTDVAARLVAEHLGPALGQTVVVENKAGAGGTIGAAYVANADADGYTLLFGSAAELTIANVTRKSVPFDTLRDFKPVTLIGRVPFLLVTNAKLPPKDMKSFLEWAKANPGKVNYSSFGSNTTNHLTGEAFKAAAGIDATHVPYKGSSPSITDLLGGQVQYTFDTITATLPHVKSGGLRAIAVTLPERTALLPDLPTVSESGLPGFVGGTWFGVMAPARTPPEVVDRLGSELRAVLQSAAVRKAFGDKGIEPAGLAPAEFAQFIGSEQGRWRDLAKKIGLEPQ
ncbi:MAG: Bug family tripartite tricarboxylate transporter substrate binding protein [Lautropia sp.]